MIENQDYNNINRLKITTFIICSIFIATSIIVQSVAIINLDVAWHLWVAQSIMDGSQLYIDIIEPNMPLIYYLRMPVIWLADILSMSEITMIIVVQIMVAFICFFLTRHIIINTTNISKLLKSGLICAVCYAIFLLPIALYVVTFGEKEHIFITLAIPYFFLTYAAIENTKFSIKIRIIVAILAAIGICIKPFFVFPFFAAEIYLAISKKKISSLFRLESLIIGGIGVAYLVAVYLIYPEYFDKQMPLNTYGYTSFSITSMLISFGHSLSQLLPSVMVIVIVSRLKTSNFLSFFITIFIACIFTGGLQFKGWAYHMIPAMALGAILLIEPLIVFIQDIIWLFQGKKKLKNTFTKGKNDGDVYFEGFIVAIFTFPALALLAVGGATKNYNNDNFVAITFNQLRPYVEEYKDEGPLLVFSGLYDAFPLVNYTGIEWNWHFSSVWLAGGVEQFIEKNEDKSQEWLEEKILWKKRLYMDHLVNDMNEKLPSLIVISENANKVFSQKRTHLEFALDDNRFRKIWSNYMKLTDLTVLGKNDEGKEEEVVTHNVYIRKNIDINKKIPLNLEKKSGI